MLAPGNPTLWRGVPVASIQKSFGSSGRDWKPWKKFPIPCKLCTYRFIRYSSTCYGKVRINPLMANIRNPDYFASPVEISKIVFRPNFFEIGLFGLMQCMLYPEYRRGLWQTKTITNCGPVHRHLARPSYSQDQDQGLDPGPNFGHRWRTVKVAYNAENIETPIEY